ncbi:MAG: hypothetical protein RL472_1602 [Pseudomonadota bacterium]
MRQASLRFTVGLAMLIVGLSPASASLRLIGVTPVPQDAAGSNLPVGGLSGVDYDPASGTWFLISDDKSEHGPARYWQAAIRISASTPPKIFKLRTIPIRRTNGGYYPGPGSGEESLDSESLRTVPRSRSIIWTSEGDARDGFGPAIRTMSFSGRLSETLPLPRVFSIDRTQSKGPRANLSFEGLSFEPGGKHLWVSLEAPLIEDGPLVGRDSGAAIRLSRFTYPRFSLAAQFAYAVEPIGPAPQDRLADNGVSEIVALDSKHLLVLERSGIQQPDGDFAFRSRLFCADLTDAQNVADIGSLRDQTVRAATKRLVFDFGSVSSPRFDNVEGMTLGPRLSNGNRTIVFVTDNDFSPRRQTQLIAFEIIPDHKRTRLTETLCQSLSVVQTSVSSNH